jgi:hypothetical protein
MFDYKRYNSDKLEDLDGEWVRYIDVRDIPETYEVSRFYINAWGMPIWDECGDWIDFGALKFLIEKYKKV